MAKSVIGRYFQLSMGLSNGNPFPNNLLKSLEMKHKTNITKSLLIWGPERPVIRLQSC